MIIVSPEMAFSGKGGTGMQGNFSSKRSCNQSKCLYLRLTAKFENWKKKKEKKKSFKYFHILPLFYVTRSTRFDFV